jgi:hypothetical protein
MPVVGPTLKDVPQVSKGDLVTGLNTRRDALLRAP